MESLRNAILEVKDKHQNVHFQCFVPEDELREILTRDTIHEALCDREISKLEPYYIEQAIDVILKGARRIFAILVIIQKTQCICRFIEDEKYQEKELDYGLPFDREKLDTMFPNRSIAHPFYQEQWHFAAPVFSDSLFTRVLEPKTILPFVWEKYLSQGGFGTVYEIEIAPSHQRFPSNRGLVRKEFKAQDDIQSVYEAELRNLGTLKLLRHPNILEVLCSYVYRKEFNLIFPIARDGTLEALLSGPRPESFKSDTTLLGALSGLCSAVSAVHRFTSSSYKLELIGCHHDLKPANVLVDGSTFLLADFGLSRFKQSYESSGSLARNVHPYYASPESCKSKEDSTKPKVGRSSDIWSLGCIISEVVTYMLDGAQGVSDFDQQRGFRDGALLRHRFHHGGQENPAVMAWIKKLECSESSTQQMLGHLVQKMLQLEPRSRPQAPEIEANIRFIVIEALCQPVHRLYEEISNQANSIELTLERTWFDGWRYACGVLEPHRDDLLGRWHPMIDYVSALSTLELIPDRLHAILAECKNPKSRIFEPLRQLNDLLLDTLSHEGQVQARRYRGVQILSTESDTIELAKMGEDSAVRSQDRRLIIQATIKCMTELLETRPVHPAFIDPSRLEKKDVVGDFKRQYLKGNNREDTRVVLVESRIYKEHYADTRTATELRERLEKITSILQQANCLEDKDAFRVLPCVGFYQDPASFSCGLVYDFPSRGQEVIILRTKLEQTEQRPDQHPSLERRFQLTQALVSSVFQFHAVSWLQKSISSYNIVFFYPHDEPYWNAIANPYFLGFLYSRSNDAEAFTEGPTEDPHHRDYQHPEYRSSRLKAIKYRLEYDYYSLGLVLLEIGLWKPLGKILKGVREKSKNSSSSIGRSISQTDGILRYYTPRLRVIMGTRYQDIVETCLRGSFGVSTDMGGTDRHSQLQLSFFHLVVEQLAACKV